MKNCEIGFYLFFYKIAFSLRLSVSLSLSRFLLSICNLNSQRNLLNIAAVVVQCVLLLFWCVCDVYLL